MQTTLDVAALAGVALVIVGGLMGYSKLTGKQEEYMGNATDKMRALTEVIDKLNDRVISHHENRDMHVSPNTITTLFSKLETLTTSQADGAVQMAELRKDVKFVKRNCRFCPSGEEIDERG